MCQYRSGIAIMFGGTVTVRTLHGNDSHNDIRDHYGIVDDITSVMRQAAVEYIPEGALYDYGTYLLQWDDDKPDWATDEVEAEVARQMRAVCKADDLSAWSGYLDLRSLTTLPEGVTLSAGGDLYLGSLTTLPEGVALSAGRYLYLRSLTTLPEGVTLSAGEGLDLRSMTTLPEGVNVTAKRIIFKDN